MPQDQSNRTARPRRRRAQPTQGVYEIPIEDYLADPVPGGSLSSSGARAILPPSCPAKFRWREDHPEPPTRRFDLGHGAHTVVLGSGPELVAVEADSWRTKAAKEAAEAAHAEGKVPLLAVGTNGGPSPFERIQAMAAAIREHPYASALFDPDYGQPEQTLIWRDGPSGIWRRGRLDWLPEPGPRRLIIPDYKTARSAEREAFSRAIAEYRYDQQGDWYRAAALALGLAEEDAAFVFVVQEIDPPYLINVVQLTPAALRVGAARNRRAIDIYAQCVAEGRWPGYVEDVTLVGLPAWVENRDTEEYLL